MGDILYESKVACRGMAQELSHPAKSQMPKSSRPNSVDMKPLDRLIKGCFKVPHMGQAAWIGLFLVSGSMKIISRQANRDQVWTCADTFGLKLDKENCHPTYRKRQSSKLDRASFFLTLPRLRTWPEPDTAGISGRLRRAFSCMAFVTFFPDKRHGRKSDNNYVFPRNCQGKVSRQSFRDGIRPLHL
jgi:hypothetical protein